MSSLKQNVQKVEMHNSSLKFTLISTIGLFNYGDIQRLFTKLHSNSPEDSSTKTWALIVFKKWYFNLMIWVEAQ